MKIRRTSSAWFGFALLLAPWVSGTEPEKPKPEDSITLPKLQIKG